MTLQAMPADIPSAFDNSRPHPSLRFFFRASWLGIATAYLVAGGIFLGMNSVVGSLPSFLGAAGALLAAVTFIPSA